MAKKYAIGIDLGGTAIKYGICSEDGELLDQDSVESPADAPKEKILEALAKLVEKALKSAQQQGIKISAIGLGTPGSVDVERGFLIGSTPNFKHWKNAAISEYLQSRFSLPAFADNDANVMAYGEFSFGAGKDADNVVCVTLGTGIGGGIIIDGELYRGSHYSGAEIGHMTIIFDGRACNCGGTGCWEQYASASAMVKDYNRENHDNQVGDS
ncbi:MAG: ROK family protein, partial [Calditrichia bacterium]